MLLFDVLLALAAFGQVQISFHDTHMCTRTLTVTLTAPEIVVNLLTWSLGFPLMKCEMSTPVLCSRRSLVVRFVLSHRLLKKQHSLGPQR